MAQQPQAKPTPTPAPVFTFEDNDDSAPSAKRQIADIPNLTAQLKAVPLGKNFKVMEVEPDIVRVHVSRVQKLRTDVKLTTQAIKDSNPPRLRVYAVAPIAKA